MKGKRTKKSAVKRVGQFCPLGRMAAFAARPPLVLNENSSFLRPPHHPAIPAKGNTVPTLPPGPTTAASSLLLVEGPGGPLSAVQKGRKPETKQAARCQRAAAEGSDIQLFSPETQTNFRLPHAAPVVPSSSNRPGQEARRPAGRELPTGDFSNLRDGREAGGGLDNAGAPTNGPKKGRLARTRRNFRPV